MKLFYWGCLDSLARYACGAAVALAATKEQAIEEILYRYKLDNSHYDYDFGDGNELDNKVAAFRVELETSNPDVFDEPHGLIFKGSE